MSLFFFFNDTATTEIYTLSLHDALPICAPARAEPQGGGAPGARGARPTGARLAHRAAHGAGGGQCPVPGGAQDRKSTRLNSSHANISYAVFCLKKKKQILPSRLHDQQS